MSNLEICCVNVKELPFLEETNPKNLLKMINILD